MLKWICFLYILVCATNVSLSILFVPMDLLLQTPPIQIIKETWEVIKQVPLGKGAIYPSAQTFAIGDILLNLSLISLFLLSILGDFWHARWSYLLMVLLIILFPVGIIGELIYVEKEHAAQFFEAHWRHIIELIVASFSAMILIPYLFLSPGVQAKYASFHRSC